VLAPTAVGGYDFLKPPCVNQPYVVSRLKVAASPLLLARCQDTEQRTFRIGASRLVERAHELRANRRAVNSPAE
ncbi:MAG: hypothetical protein WCT12_23085, partial [Verrucomicrobiota bacterium]